MRGLETGEADRHGDGQVDIEELREYLVERLREDAPYQTPTKSGYLEGQLYIARTTLEARSQYSTRLLSERARLDAEKKKVAVERARLKAMKARIAKEGIENAKILREEADRLSKRNEAKGFWASLFDDYDDGDPGSGWGGAG